MKKQITIFGYGYVAKFIIDKLINLGWTVYCTSRQLRQQDHTQNNSLYIVHFLDPELPSIIHSSTAVLSSVPSQLYSLDPVLHKYFDIISQAKLNWCGYLSSTGVYGDHGGNWVTEKTECKPTHVKAFQRLLVEEKWLDLFFEHNIPVHIFRLAGIYGPGRNCLERLMGGKDYTIFKQDHFFSRVHVEDICNAIIESINHPTKCEIYNLCDDEPAPLHVVEKYGARLLGREPLAKVSLKDVNLSEQAMNFFLDNKRVSNKKIKECLKFKFLYPNYKVGLKTLCKLL